MHFGIYEQLRAVPPRTAQKALVQAIDIDVGSVVIEQRHRGRLLAQHGHAGAGRGAAQQPGSRALAPKLLVQRVQGRHLLGAGNEKRATRCDQGRLVIQRRLEKGAAGACQRTHLGRPVTLHEHRRRTPGAVHSRLWLALEQRYAGVRREEEG